MILIGLGANLPSEHGTPAQTLERAKEALYATDIKLLTSSRTYLSAPVPVSDDPWYANAVISIETLLTPNALLKRLNEIETDFGRVRSSRNAPRVLDLDLIAYHEEVIEEKTLTLPHPRMHERAFVLKPLQEIAPQWHHPLLRETVSDLIEKVMECDGFAFEQTRPLKKGEVYRVAG